MSVQSEIDRLTAARDALAAWLTEKGVTVPEDATLETLVVLAAQITNGVLTVNNIAPDENGNVEIDTSDLFVVTFTGNSAETEFTSDRTFAEISEAYEAGMRVVAVQGKLIIDLAQFVSGEFAAFDVWMMPFISSATVMYRHYVVFADDTVQFQDNYLLASDGSKSGMLKLTGSTLSIASAGEDYVVPSALDNIDTGVLTVNGVEPDENGNVEIEAGGVQTVNGVEPDENGNVDVNVESDVFIATYGTTTYDEIAAAYAAGKIIKVMRGDTPWDFVILKSNTFVFSNKQVTYALDDDFMISSIVRSDGLMIIEQTTGWKLQGNGGKTTFLPATHASTHKTGGTDPITPDDIGAAAPPIYRTITLSASSWDSTALTQTVTVSGVLADETAQLISPMPKLSNQTEYYEAGVRATAQAADSLTFTCDVIPTVNLTVYVTITEVTA